MQYRWLLLAALAAAPTALAAQGKGVPDSLVLAHEFSTPKAEFVRAWLEKGKVYRLEVTNARLLQVRSRTNGLQLPLTRRIEDMARPSNTVAFEIAPSFSAEYEFRVNGLFHGAAPVRVYEDGDATRRLRKVIAS